MGFTSALLFPEFSRVEKENLDLRSRVTDYQSYIKRIQMDSSQLKRQLQDSNVVGTAAFSHRKATSRSGRTEVRDIPDAMPKFTTTVTVHPTLEDLQNRITDATNQTYV